MKILWKYCGNILKLWFLLLFLFFFLHTLPFPFFFSLVFYPPHMCTLFCPHPLLFPTPPPSRRLSHSFILSFFLFPFPFVSRRLSQFQSSPALSISSLSFFFFPLDFQKISTSASWLIWSKLLADLNRTLWVRSFFVFIFFFLFFFFLSVFLCVYGCLAVGLCYLISVFLDCGLCFG